MCETQSQLSKCIQHTVELLTLLHRLYYQLHCFTLQLHGYTLELHCYIIIRILNHGFCKDASGLQYLYQLFDAQLFTTVLPVVLM